jgi:flavin-dependent dehydrogenase
MPWAWAVEVEIYPKDPKDMERFEGVARFDVGYEGSGYSWAFPKKAHLSVGTASVVGRTRRLKKNLEAYLKRLKLQDWQIKSKGIHPIPFRSQTFAPKHCNAMLVGDAAGITDPISWEGMQYAIRSALICKEAMISYFDEPEVASENYYGRLNKEIVNELLIAFQIAKAFYFRPILFHITVLAFRKVFVERYYGIITGQMTYTHFVSGFIQNLFLKREVAHERATR